MKKLLWFVVVSFFLVPVVAGAQDIAQKDVPSAIVNQFKKAYPNARDVEWEKKGDLYEVEFETGIDKDHEIYYNKSGEIVRHKEELMPAELPDAVKNTIAKSFADYHMDDIDKISADGKVVYVVELKSTSNKWEVTFSEKGDILRRKPD